MLIDVVESNNTRSNSHVTLYGDGDVKNVIMGADLSAESMTISQQCASD